MIFSKLSEVYGHYRFFNTYAEDVFDSPKSVWHLNVHYAKMRAVPGNISILAK